MARRRSKVDPDASPSKTINIPFTLHKRLKQEAADRDLTIMELLAEVFDFYKAERSSGRGPMTSEARDFMEFTEKAPRTLVRAVQMLIEYWFASQKSTDSARQAPRG